MPHLGVIDARLLLGFRQGSLYGTAGTAYSSLLEHQLGSPKPYDVPPAWVIPPRSTGGCRRPDLRKAFYDLALQTPRGGAVVVEPSPLSSSLRSLVRGRTDVFWISEGGKSVMCEDFIESVQSLRDLHQHMGAVAMVRGPRQVLVGDEFMTPNGEPVRFRAETIHPLGRDHLKIDFRLSRRPPRYWGKSFEVNVAADQKTGEIRVVSGHPRLVERVRPFFSDLVGLVQYFDACVQSAELEGVLPARDDQLLLTDFLGAPRPPERGRVGALGDTHLFSTLSIGRAKFVGPLIVWAGASRRSLGDADRQFGPQGYVLLCERHTEEILQATPGCRYRLSAALEGIGSPALQRALEKVAAGEEYVMAHGLQASGKGRLARVLAFPHSDEDSSMMIGRVELTANGHEAGIRIS